MTLFSGKCAGGPYNGRSLHHGSRQIPVAIYEAHPMRTIELAPLAEPPLGIKVGTYAYNDTLQLWIWKPPA